MEVDGITFEFDEDWKICKWDDTAFHGHFQGVGGGSKACDLIAMPVEGNELWLIEVKDYRRHPRVKSVDLVDEVGAKVRDTLAAGWAAQRNANAEPERSMAHQARRRWLIRIALHLEQAVTGSRLAPGRKRDADLTTKLKQKLRAIDPHPVITRIGATNVPWTTRNA